MYIESSYQSANDTAVLESAVVPSTSSKPRQTVCLSFWYHMYGQHVDKLNVFRMTGQTLPSAPVWTKQGTQGNQWRRALIGFTSSSPFRVSLS